MMSFFISMFYNAVSYGFGPTRIYILCYLTIKVSIVTWHYSYVKWSRNIFDLFALIFSPLRNENTRGEVVEMIDDGDRKLDGLDY